MLKNHLSDIIKTKLEFEPTKGQLNVINTLSDFTLTNEEDEVFILKGFAGTGKTTLISAYIQVISEMRMKTILLAPTGRAAKVLSSYANKSAFTIHKKIYRQKSSKDGFGNFVLDKNLHSNTIFIVDEASMISNSSYESSVFGSGRLLDDLLTYVYNDRNCKLILIGDTAQLPPVGLDMSPALDAKFIESHGFRVNNNFMTEVVRQAENSGILYNATKLRSLIESDQCNEYLKFDLEDFNDIRRISGEELIETITESYDKNGLHESMIVSRSNKRANKYNQGIRNQILWYESEIAIGDLLMVVKNNYYWLPEGEATDFIANGDIAEIVSIQQYHELYDRKFADVTLRFLDYDNLEIDVKIMLDTLYIETASLSSEDNREFFYKVLEDYQDEKPRKKQYEGVKNDEFFNALQVKFAYGVTCHKAQGGQWDVVFVDQGFLREDMLNKEYFRWLYTALTRAKKKLYLVNFNKEFFEEEQD